MRRGALAIEAGTPNALFLTVPQAAHSLPVLTDQLGHKPLLGNSCQIAPADKVSCHQLTSRNWLLGRSTAVEPMASGIDDTGVQ